MKSLPVTVIIMTVLCSCQLNRKKEVSSKTDLHNAKDKYDSLNERKSLLQGIWAKSEDDNALFEIKGDSIYYMEDPKPVFYQIENDLFKVYIEGEVYSSRIIKLTSDSLIRVEYDEEVKLYKRR